MPVPSVITDLLPVAGDNSPAGTDTIGMNMDNYIRAHAAFISQLYTDQQGHFSASASAHVSTAIEFTATGTGAATRTVGAKLKDFVSVLDFDGADLGAKLQAAYDARNAVVTAGDGVAAGILIYVPPRQDGDYWIWSTPVDLENNGFCHIVGGANVFCELGANLTYMIRTGVTTKSNYVTIEGLTFRPGDYTATSAILVGGGTNIVLKDICFQHYPGPDTGSFTDGILLDRSQDPTSAGVSFALLERISDSGGSPCTNSMIKARGLVSSTIRQVRVGNATTYGVYLDSTPGDVQSNLIEGIYGEAGSATTTALVYINANTSNVTLNTIRTLSGNNTVDYGIKCAGAAIIANNSFDIDDISFTTAAFDNGGTASRNLNLIKEKGAFTPTWASSGTQPSIGDGTLTGYYVRNGSQVTVTYDLACGSTTSYGTGTYTLSLPSHLNSVATHKWEGMARAFDNGVGFIIGSSDIGGGSSVVSASFQTGGSWGATVPMTWTASDLLTMTASYSI